MTRALRIVLSLLIGYALGAALGYGAIEAFSGNTHDKDLEAAMTATFATGPLGALLGAVVAVFLARQR